MTNNDLLRRVRYALKLDVESMAEISALGGYEIRPVDMLKILKKEEENGFAPCDNITLNAFLDGLIIFRRGKQEPKQGVESKPADVLDNNLILRKLRIALELNEQGMLEILEKAGVQISKSELSAMFRGKDHRNYKPCGDQFMRNFIRGLTLSAS